MLLAAIPTATPTIATQARAFFDYYHSPEGRAEERRLFSEGAKLLFDVQMRMIRNFCHVDDNAAQVIFGAWGEFVDKSNRAWVEAAQAERATEKKATDEPRCGQCGQPFGTWREAWLHEGTAHAMEQELFAKDHS
jgi:hypothetical protein